MKNKQLLFGLAFALGLFFVAGYSIDSRGFHSVLTWASFGPRLKVGTAMPGTSPRDLRCWLHWS